MKNIKFALLLVLAALSLLWWWADPLLIQGDTYFALRTLAVNYTGVLAMGTMSVAMILALRPAALEPLLGGMDKAYRLHKWLGIAGLSVGVVHWLWAKGTKWAVGWGWLEKPARGPRPEQTVELFRFFQEQRGLAESIGEWAFYLFAVLAAIALIKRFPYRRFVQTHRVMAAVYLTLVVHGVVLLPFAYWTQPVGIVMAVLMAAGSWAALRSLAGRIGSGRRAHGRIERVVQHPHNEVLEVGLRLDTPWPGHQAGQFAFVTFDEREGPHPFTISSAWNGDSRMDFMIKPLGDYTRRLPATLKAGDPVRVEGPYGRFDFSGAQARQIWVAGGIGITPFVARMQARTQDEAHAGAGAGAAAPVDLFYSTSAPDEGFIARLRELAAQARVKLHVLVSQRDGRLDADGICRKVPDWKLAGVWFCGPAGFGATLRDTLAARGLPAERFHQELFEMR
ncbi:MAG: ferric reductase [Rhodocyclaceae bacterium]|nr:MAG: ferric reductase [Rhodocyclaceae bacterium]